MTLIDTDGFINAVNPEDPGILMTSGRMYLYLHPHPDQFTADDVVTSMSRIPRFCGHGFNDPLDLNQHHMLVAQLGVANGFGIEDILGCLLHDIHETFVGDVSRPQKLAMRLLARQNGQDMALVRTPFDMLEERGASAVWKKWGRDATPDIKQVKLADNWALAIEAELLFGSALGLELPPERVRPMSKAGAEQSMAMVLAYLELGRPLSIIVQMVRDFIHLT